jgi:hypothetical protein
VEIETYRGSRRKFTSYGMQKLLKHFLKYTVDKTLATSDWAGPDALSRAKQHDAALDVHIGERLYKELTRLKRNNTNERATTRGPVVKQGDRVIYFANGNDCAQLEVTHVGCKSKKVRYGKKKQVKEGTVVARLLRVLLPSTRPTNDFNPTTEDTERGMRGWKRTKTTLGKIWEMRDKQELLLVLPIGCLKVIVEDAMNESTVGSSEEDFEDCLSAPEEKEDLGEPDSNENDGEEEDDPTIPASKKKGDLFHKTHSIPLRRDEPSFTLVTRMVVQATWIFEPVNYRNVTSHLAKKGILLKPKSWIISIGIESGGINKFAAILHLDRPITKK